MDISRSLWMETELPTFPPLKQNLSVDVCIIGGGIAGLSCAYTLVNRGKKVALLEKSSSCCGQTMRTSGHLTWTLDDRFYQLEKYFGLEGSQLAAKSHAAAIDYIEKIIQSENIACDFERVNGYLFLGQNDHSNSIQKEFEAIKRMGMPIEKISYHNVTDTFDLGESLCLPGQAQFHIGKYMQGLLRALQNKGALIFNHTHVTKILDKRDCFVQTKQGYRVHANAVIVATCTPINNRVIIHTKQAPYRTYVIGALVPKGLISKGLYWDTDDPYHYVRLQQNLTDPNLEWLIVGGEDHKTGQEKNIQKRYEQLCNWAKQRFPLVKDISYHWSGQVFEPIDGLGFIGKNPTQKNVYIITGDSGNGLTHGTIAGLLLPDLIEQKYNSWAKLYAPRRKTFLAADEFIHENVNTALQYLDWLSPNDRKSIASLESGSGAIFRKGLKKIAVYKDENHQIHCCSAFCPHLGGCVRWNSEEKSWDCPCHGSRFAVNGQILTGPANQNLKVYQSITKDD